MQEKQISSTAILTNHVRAVHQTTAAEPKILLDPVSIEFAKQFEGSPALAAFSALPQPLLMDIQSSLVLRNRFAEDVAHELATQSLCQYAILGAGFDTFAYRQPAWAQTIPIFELDHPATQAAKRAVLQTAGYALPANLHFCQIDFQKTSLREALSATPFQFDVPTAFSWLGVTQYIGEEAIRATLEFVLSLPSSSTIVFSFIATDAVLGEADRQLVAMFEKPAAARGEPFISRFDPVYLDTLLRDMGFGDVYYFSPELAQTRYFADRADGLSAPKAEQLMRVVV